MTISGYYLEFLENRNTFLNDKDHKNDKKKKREKNKYRIQDNVAKRNLKTLIHDANGAILKRERESESKLAKSGHQLLRRHDPT